MLFAFLYSCLRLLLDVVDVRLRVRDPEAELLLLRHQLRVLRPQVQRPDLEPADRVIMAALSRVVNRAALVGLLVQPATVLGWHRELVRRRWAAFGQKRGPGRPVLDPAIQTLILHMAKGNPKWGCVRVRGELLKLGYRVSATSIRKLLRKNRIGQGGPCPRTPLSERNLLHVTSRQWAIRPRTAALPLSGLRSSTMSVLLAYAAKSGSTQRIAEHIATTLRVRGLHVEMQAITVPLAPGRHDAFVIGFAAHIASRLDDAEEFMRRNRTCAARKVRRCSDSIGQVPRSLST